MAKSLPHSYDACRVDFSLPASEFLSQLRQRTEVSLVLTPLRANRINKVDKTGAHSVCGQGEKVGTAQPREKKVV